MAHSSIVKPTFVWRECIAGIAQRSNEIVVCMNEEYVVLPLEMKHFQQSLMSVLKENHVKKVFTAGRKLYKFFLKNYASLMDEFDFVLDELYEGLRYPCKTCEDTECPTVRAYWVWRTHTHQMRLDEKNLFDNTRDEVKSLSEAFDAVKIEADSTEVNRSDDGSSNEFEVTDNGCCCEAQTYFLEPVKDYVYAIHHFKCDTGVKRNCVWTFKRVDYTIAIAADEEVCVVCTDSAIITIPWNVRGWEKILFDTLCKDSMRVYIAGTNLSRFLRKKVNRELREEQGYDFLKRPCKSHGVITCPWTLAFFLWKKYATRKPSLYRGMNGLSKPMNIIWEKAISLEEDS